MKNFSIGFLLFFIIPAWSSANCSSRSLDLDDCEDAEFNRPQCIYECEKYTRNNENDFNLSGTVPLDNGRCPVGDQDHNFKKVRSSLYDTFKRQCEILEAREERKREEKEFQEEKEKSLEDMLEKQIEDQKKAQEEAQRQKEEMNRLMAQECKEENRKLVSQRDRIESRVRAIESEVDELRDSITKNKSIQSEEEQRLKEEIQKLTQDQRDTLLKYETQIQDAENKSDQLIRDLERKLLIEVHKLENITDNQNIACNNRFNEYLLVREGCFNRALQEVSVQRENYYKQLYSGRQSRTPSEAFSENLQTIEERFTNLLYSKEQLCYDRAIGNTEQVICSLSSLRDRDSICQQTENKGEKCPTAQARVIENKLLEKLSEIKNQEEIIEMEINSIYKSLEEIPGKKAQAIENLKKDLENKHQKFTERFDSLKVRLEQARIRRIAEIEKSTQKIQRLLQEDPARHFSEQIRRAVNTCCSMESSILTVNECTDLNGYLSDVRRNQFIFAQPSPIHREIIRSSSSSGIPSGVR